MILMPTIGTIGAVAGVGGAPPPVTSAVDYVGVTAAGSVASVSGTFVGLPAPIAGQRAFVLVQSKLAPTGCTLNGTAATQLQQVNTGVAFATLYRQTGWEDDELPYAVTFAAGSTFIRVDAWRTYGWAFDTGSLVATHSAVSSTAGLTLSLDKPAAAITLAGGRYQTDPTGRGAVTEDFDNASNAWAGRLMDLTAQSGTWTFTGPSSAQINRACAAFDMIVG